MDNTWLLWKITRLIICFVARWLLNGDVFSSDDARVMSDKNGIGLGLDIAVPCDTHTATHYVYTDEVPGHTHAQIQVGLMKSGRSLAAATNRLCTFVGGEMEQWPLVEFM